MKSFITGSRAYGQPNADSDLDLVILVDESTKAQLVAFSDLSTEPIRFGKLNIIACTTEEEFTCWKYGTMSLIHRRDESQKTSPVNNDDPFGEWTGPTTLDLGRDMAKTYLDSYRREAGVEIKDTDSGERK